MYKMDENGAIDAMVNRSSPQEETLLVQALYPYSYEITSGQQVSFEANDIFILVEKSNNDWWHVYKDGQNFYVPANYVCEATDVVDEEILSTGSLNSQGETNTLSPSSESSLPDLEEDTNKEAIEKCTLFGGSDSERIYANIPINVEHESHRRHHSAGNRSPFTRPKSATLPAGWVVETDHNSGRPQYVNTKTKEIMLKPPRTKSVTKDEDDNFERNSLSLPKGWTLQRQESVSEEFLYVNERNNQMWQSSIDETGRKYYYNINGGNSCWELPLFDDINVLKVPENDEKDPKGRLTTRPRMSSEGSEPSVVNLRHKSSQLHLRNSKSASMIANVGAEMTSFSKDEKDPKGRLTTRPRMSSEGSEPSVVHLRHKLSQLHLRNSKSASMIANVGAEMTSFSKGHQRTCSDQMRGSLIMTDDFGPPPSLPQLNYTIKKEGTVNRKKLCEKSGKKIKKTSWSPCYMKLSSSNIIIYKNQNTATPKPGFAHGRPESSCDLRGAVIEKMPDENKKRNIFQVATVSKLCFLIQVEDVSEFRDWYHMIYGVMKYLSESEPLDHGIHARLYGEISPKLQTQTSMSAFSSRASLKKIRDGDKKNIRDKLKKLMSRRPTLDELHKKGIMKDITFGCHIAKLCAREQTTVPSVVTRCIEAIEAKGLDLDGLYRISGNVSAIQQLRITVDQEEDLKFGERPFDDVHVLTGTLKLYFRELPEPLFPFDSYTAIVDSLKKSSKEEKTLSLRTEINNLPSPNLETVIYLFKHLRRIMENSEKNRMHAHNIAIVFGPTLLAPREEQGNIAVNMVYQNQVIEYILLEYDNVLG